VYFGRGNIFVCYPSSPSIGIRLILINFRGGNLAAVTTLKAVEAGLHVNLKAQILMAPVCDNTATLESETWSQRPHAPLLTAKLMTFYRELCFGPQHSPTWPGKHWTASPVRAPQNLLRKCPKTIFIIAGQDLLYAESVLLAQRLREEGVDVDEKIYEKAPHPFMAMDRYLESGRHAISYIVEQVKEILVAYVEDSDIEPSDIKQERDRENLLEQAKSHWKIGQTGSDSS
jgi:acetyl esterase/lipase